MTADTNEFWTPTDGENLGRLTSSYCESSSIFGKLPLYCKCSSQTGG
jgi:hypothetical protein